MLAHRTRIVRSSLRGLSLEGYEPAGHPGALGEMLLGDFVHFGPSARWRSDHVLELEHPAQDRVSHYGRFSLEIVKA